MPWFDLGAVYRARRDAYRVSNGGFVVAGYGEWMRRFVVAQAVSPVHPSAGFVPERWNAAWNAGASGVGVLKVSVSESSASQARVRD